MIEITAEQISRIHALLGHIKDAPQKAIYSVLNRAVSTVKSTSSSEIRKTYTVKHTGLTSSQNIKVKNAGPSELEATVTFGGNLIPLIMFDVNPKQPKRQTVSAAVLKSGRKKEIIHAYVTNLGRYGVGAFDRKTGTSRMSTQLYGPSSAHMVDNAEVLDNIEAAAMETVEKRVEHEISRILNGYT